MADIFVLLKHKIRLKIILSYQERHQKYRCLESIILWDELVWKCIRHHEVLKFRIYFFQSSHIDFKIFNSIG